jgi:hypothetical protein
LRSTGRAVARAAIKPGSASSAPVSRPAIASARANGNPPLLTAVITATIHRPVNDQATVW